eukprot:TRINITY_DN10969_c0_g2_i1.p1 TRINITY_DN10969_c0_g2~~TRINITY_DN10969_c0_g2_i1.p1  ORF type:complete len:116 (+),score=14.47 TRINITY_DN10969_c0_g2_i1:302-649(+)
MIVAYFSQTAVSYRALLMGLELAKNLNINDIIIKGDSMVIIDNLQKSGNMSWNLMHLWRKTKLQLEKLISWHVPFCRRTANGLIDTFAKMETPSITVSKSSHPSHMLPTYKQQKQ